MVKEKLENLKTKVCQEKNKCALVVGSVAGTAMTAMTAFAADSAAEPKIDTTSLGASFKSGMSDIGTAVVSIVGTILPIGLVVLGVGVTVKYGIKFVKHLSK